MLAAIRSGDAAALGVLYDRYGRLVLAVTYRMLGSHETAEEVTQDVFHAVWRRAATYRADRGAVRGWLLAIARNAAVDRLRVRRNDTTREGELDEAREIPGADSVEDVVNVRLRDGRVRDVVRTLPEEQRTVLDLAYWGGLSQSEISARTGAPLGTVKSRVRIAMAKLREGLHEEGHEE